MALSCLLALSIMLYPAWADLFPQDPSDGAQAAATAASQPAQGDTNQQQAPAEKTPEAAQTAPDDAARAPDAKKAEEEKKPAAANERRGKRNKHNRNAKAPADDGPRKVVVRHGGVKEPTAQIVPNIPRDEAIKQRQNAEGLLGSAEVSLRVLGSRTLRPPQQETVAQVLEFMDKARSALKDGDIQRAQTLALKARLLADDLVKH